MIVPSARNRTRLTTRLRAASFASAAGLTCAVPNSCALGGRATRWPTRRTATSSSDALSPGALGERLSIALPALARKLCSEVPSPASAARISSAANDSRSVPRGPAATARGRARARPRAGGGPRAGRLGDHVGPRFGAWAGRASTVLAAGGHVGLWQPAPGPEVPWSISCGSGAVALLELLARAAPAGVVAADVCSSTATRCSTGGGAARPPRAYVLGRRRRPRRPCASALGCACAAAGVGHAARRASTCRWARSAARAPPPPRAPRPRG